MNKTKIEWVKNPDGSPGYTWNPITGCLNGCPYCYARKLANGRLKERYLANKHLGYDGGAPKWMIESDPFYPRFWPEKISELVQGNRDRRKPRGIFTCDMSDLFGIGVPDIWTARILDAIKGCWRDRFYLLTKQPQNLAKFSPFPDNCWVGVTATNQEQYDQAIACLKDVGATVKFLSIEPLLERIDLFPYIGYNKPIDKEVSHGSETERGNGLPSCGAGGTGDRRIGASLEGQEQIRDTLGKGGTNSLVRQATGRERYREVSTSQGNGELEANPLFSSPASVEARSRPNTRGIDYQSQKRRQEGQPARESGVGNIFRTNDSYVKSASDRPCAKTERGEQRNGEAIRRSREGDTIVAGGNSVGGENQTRPQGSNTVEQIWGGSTRNMGCNIREDVGITLIIIGAQTKPYKPPEIEWVQSIVKAANEAGVKVFLKDNLLELLNYESPETEFAFSKDGFYRQEMP